MPCCSLPALPVASLRLQKPPSSQSHKNLYRSSQAVLQLTTSRHWWANYLTPLVGKWLGLTDDLLYGVAFLLGYGGLKGVETFYLYMISRATNKP